MNLPNGLSEGSVNGVALLDGNGDADPLSDCTVCWYGVSGPKGQYEWHHGRDSASSVDRQMGRFFIRLTLSFAPVTTNEQEEKKMKRTLTLVMVLVLVAISMVALAESYTVGIGQFAVHGSLDNCRTGFLEGLAEEGIVEGENLTVLYENAQADMGIAQQIAAQFASKPVDLMVGIATPMAQACFNAADGKIPLIFNAVSDPIASGFANEDGSNAGNVTGVSDALPVKAQLATIRAMLPDAKTVGILYTTSETNSVSTIEVYKAYAADFGFEIVESGITTAADIPLALDALLPKVDCLSNLTDNTVVQALSLVLDKANAAKKPVFGSEVEQVKLGCIAAEGLDYVNLGKQCGVMAATVLRGEAKAEDIPYEIITEPSLYINENALSAFGITLPDDLAARAQKAE